MRLSPLHLLWLLAALISVSALAFKVYQPVQVLPRIRLAPAFSLIDQDGERLSSEDLRGHFVLYTFAYTRCSEACSGINRTMQAIQARLGEVDLGDIPMTLVTVSVDPTYDTPARLRAYAASLGADTARWRFATAPDSTVLKTIVGGGFEVYYEPDGQGGFRFDPAFVLVDGWGVIRGEYHYPTLRPDTDRILRHMSVLAEEVRNRDGPAVLAYEAAHYFLCYAP